MALTLYGVDPSIDELRWAQLHALATDARTTGLAVTASGGTRGLNIATGQAYAAGVYADSTTVGTVTLATNVSGLPRTDYVIMNIDWTLSQTTGGTFTSVTGSPASSPVAPSLIQTPGVRWQVPLARVTVGADNATLTIENVGAAGLIAPRPIVYTGSIPAPVSINAGAQRIVSTVVVDDPGWKYRVAVSGALEFNWVSIGGNFYANVSTTVDGQFLSASRAANANQSPAFLLPVWSSARSGVKTTIQLAITTSQGWPSGTPLILQSSSNNNFTVVVHPSN